MAGSLPSFVARHPLISARPVGRCPSGIPPRSLPYPETLHLHPAFARVRCKTMSDVEEMALIFYHIIHNHRDADPGNH